MGDRKPAITISGPPGSGTTTAARLIAAQTGLDYVNTGSIFRQMATEYQMSLSDFGAYVARHPQIDQQLDLRQVELARRGGIILEGRLAGLLAQRDYLLAFTVFLNTDVNERARRCSQRDEQNIVQAAKLMEERELLERERFLKLYNLDLANTSGYNMVIDSGEHGPEAIAMMVVTAYNKWKNHG